MAARVDGMFSGWTTIRSPRERRVALSLLLTVPVTLAVIGLMFHQITPTQVALFFIAGMVFVSLSRGRLLGSSIRARAEEFPDLVALVEQVARRLGVAPPQIFIRDDYFVPVNAIGLGEPYALVISSQYLLLFGTDELAFMIGRELGHIAAGNTRILSLINATGRSNALIASLFGGWIRQTEYTADRAGMLCATPEAAMKAIAISTFHASGRRVEAAMLADQRRDIESDLTLRLGEFTGNMPYAVNRVRALETFVTSDTYRYWMDKLTRDPFPPRTALGVEHGPVDKREVASHLRRFLAFAIDVALLAIIFHAFSATVGAPVTPHTPNVPIPPDGHIHTKFVSFWPKFSDIASVRTYFQENIWLVYFPYAAILVALAGRTIGMMVLDLRVVRLDRRRVGIAQSLWRYLIGIGCTMMVIPLFFFRRVSLQDKWSGTRLIGGRGGVS
jgi:Zn-dependent protease with chaperone function/uncharacterized RDD family membrane protein YckC